MRNPFRNKTRSILSITGIAVGITIIVALGLITTGLEDSMTETLNDNAAEITVSSADSESMGTYAELNSSYEQTLANVSGVEETASVLSVYVSSDAFGSSDSSSQASSSAMASSGFGGETVSGVDPSKLNLVGVTNIVEGSVYADNSTDALIGRSIADEMNLTIGDTITVEDTEFTVTGIYETGNMMTDSSIYVSLNTLQNISDADYVSYILLKTSADANDTQISENIKATYTDLSTTTSEESAQMMSDVMGMIDTVTLAISLLAILVGGIGIVNTMVMTVYERTKEIGVLKAVGWSNRRVLLMIVGESVVLTVISGIVGSIAGILIDEIGINLLASSSEFSLGFTADTFIMAFGIAIIVGILGGLYPAYTASKLAPTEALRYE
ncbi:MAG: ABC transporter permease [Methanosphaera sp.]|nr:ABC transporter permease [Methanosphaera sp.]